jgi:transcriptional regulator GlxA family with amidase domain
MKPLDERVASAIAIMERQRAEPIGIDELARAVNLSPSYLTRLFHQHVGCAPAHYDRQQRLQRAYELITGSFLSIKEVMAAVGWNDPSHFSRDFRRQFGLSPRALRAAHSDEPRNSVQHANQPSKTRFGQESAQAANDQEE